MQQLIIKPWRTLVTKKIKTVGKLEKITNILKIAQIRDIKILENIPLHLQTMQ